MANPSARSAHIERLKERIEEVRTLRAAATKAKSFVSAGRLSSDEDKLSDQLYALESEEAAAADDVDALEPEQILDAIVREAVELPSYLLDRLISRLEAARTAQ